MNKKFLVFSSLLLFLILPFVFATSIQDSINMQISQNKVAYNYQMPAPDPQDIFLDAIKDNPEVRAAFIRMIIFIVIISILSIIDIILRGFAMWRASKKNSKVWFWLLLLISSLGILPLIYLLITKKSKEESHGKKKK
jgi:hypothetical protein